MDKVDYHSLDNAKNAFIDASKRTLKFAEPYGFIPDGRFGASANVFSLDLKPFMKTKAEQLFITLLPEGLGTADDARPDDLSSQELTWFWRNIGLKTVSVLTNDAASSGMQTILISLYLPSSAPEKVFTPEFMNGFLNGFVEGCKTVGCVYFSGETPQLKTKIVDDKLDIAGALFGLIPAGRKPIAGEPQAGDSIVFLESSGPHENGFTTLRDLASKLPEGYRTKIGDGREYYDAINAPGHLYTPLVQAVMEAGIQPTNIEPITGHGWQKLMRPKKTFRYVIEEMLPVPEVFKFVQEHAKMTNEEMLTTFNYGVGMAMYVSNEKDAKKVVDLAFARGLKAVVAGHVEEAHKREVLVKPLNVTLKGDGFKLGK